MLCVMPAGLGVMFLGVTGMTVGTVGVMRCLLVIARTVMLGGFAVMLGGVLVVFGSLVMMMFDACVVAHVYSPGLAIKDAKPVYAGNLTLCRQHQDRFVAIDT